MPRLFIAISIPALAPLQKTLASLNALRPQVKPVAADDLHLTLRFLGPMPAEQIAELAGAIDQAVAAAGARPFDLHFTRLGHFPPADRRPPRVIFAAADRTVELDQLAAAIDHSLAQLTPSIGDRDRPFHAHLTLARVNKHRRLRPGALQMLGDLLEQGAEADLGTARIKAVHLIESDLTPNGPVYTLRHTALLKSGSST